MSVLFAGSVFAMDLSVGLKGILGADNSDVKGTCIGGGFGVGAGVSCTISENHPENVSNTKLGLAAGLKAKAFVSDNIAIVAGVTGNLDCLPNLKKTSKENSSTYKFVATDFSRNAIFGSIGVEYKFSL